MLLKLQGLKIFFIFQKIDFISLMFLKKNHIKKYFLKSTSKYFFYSTTVSKLLFKNLSVTHLINGTIQPQTLAEKNETPFNRLMGIAIR